MVQTPSSLQWLYWYGLAAWALMVQGGLAARSGFNGTDSGSAQWPYRYGHPAAAFMVRTGVKPPSFSFVAHATYADDEGNYRHHVSCVLVTGVLLCLSFRRYSSTEV